MARGSRSSHLGAVGAGLLRVGDELPAVEPRMEGFLDGVGQGLLLLIVWGRRVESGEIGLSGRLKWILRGFGGKDRAGAIGRGRIAHLCAHIDVPGVAEDAEVRLFLVEVVVHGSECVSHTGRREREDLSEVSVRGDHRVRSEI